MPRCTARPIVRRVLSRHLKCPWPYAQYLRLLPCARAGASVTGDKKRKHGKASYLVKVTTPCNHVHHALFRDASSDCVLNDASATRAGSKTCKVCLPDGKASTRLKPRFSWNSRPGWNVERMSEDD